MTNGWQEVPLKEVAKPISRSIPVEAGTEYRTIGVKWWGMGAYERETIDGSRTAAKTLSIVREGDLIINKIWVRHGSVAIAGKNVDGCVGSGEFPTFELDHNRIDPKWIHWQTKMRSFWEKCDSLSRGTSGKNRIKPELFLTIKIPVPPLDEQRRIIVQVETLAAHITKAQSLRENAIEEVGLLLKSERHKIFGTMDLEKFGRPLSEVAEFLDGKRIPLNKRQRDEKKPGNIPYYGASGIVDYINEWIFDDILLLVSEDGANIEMRSKPIAFVITGKTWVNNHSHVLKFKNDVTAYYLAHYVEHSDVKPLWRGATRPKINKAALEKFVVPVPPLDEQRRIVAYLDSVQARLASLRDLQSATEEELGALLPSVLDRAFKGEL